MNHISRPLRLKLPPAPGAIQREIEYAGLTWLDFMHPTTAQMDYLHERFGFHQLHLRDVLAELQRPKLDDNDEPEYVFLVIHVPFYDALPKLPVISEIELFVGPDYVVTCHNGRIRPLVHLVQDAAKPQVQAQLFAHGPGYLLYNILDTLVGTCGEQISQRYRKLDEIDSTMFRHNVQQIVEELSFLRRDIISLRRIVRPNLPVLNQLATRERAFLHLDEGAYFGDLADKLDKLWDMLEEQKEIIEGLDSTLSGLTSYRINQEMRTFTLITVIFLPMTLIASIFGMNVVIPGSEHPYSLVCAIVLIFLFAGIMMVYFRHKRWI